MTIAHLIDTISTQLIRRYQSPRLCQQYSWWMVQAITQKNKSQLLAEKDITLTEQQQQRLDSWIHKQIIDNIPLQYLLGSVPFGQLIIAVKPPVLIPRPETEEWVYALINKLTKLTHTQLQILDIGTGSGCIGLALAHALPKSTVWAIDSAVPALVLAKKNAEKNKISNIRFVQSDLFENIPKKMPFDLIVSNPPYLSEKEWETTEKSVREWEDQNALIADNEGLALIKKIVQQAPDYLKDNKELQDNNINQLYIEIGHQQAKRAVELMRKSSYTNIQIFNDLFQKERVVSGRCGLSEIVNK